MTEVQDRLDRLRKAGRLKRRRRPGVTPAIPTETPSPPVGGTLPSHNLPPVADLVDLPGMEVVDTPSGTYLLRTVRYDFSHAQGAVSIGELLDLPVGLAEQVEGKAEMAGFDFRQVAFIDTETSGLAGGAGTIVFLTGVGTFEDDQYVVRQYFARNPAEERVYLEHVAEQMQQAQGWVSFNGKSFDMPLLRSRFIMSGMPPPPDQPHLDLLHPARRLWRQRLGACNFGNLEIQILEHQRTGQDVPSWMIPEMWFRFAKGGGNVNDMAAVLYHNQEDIVSMAPLAHVLLATFAGVIDPHPTMCSLWPGPTPGWVHTPRPNPLTGRRWMAPCHQINVMRRWLRWLPCSNARSGETKPPFCGKHRSIWTRPVVWTPTSNWRNTTNGRPATSSLPVYGPRKRSQPPKAGDQATTAPKLWLSLNTGWNDCTESWGLGSNLQLANDLAIDPSPFLVQVQDQATNS